MAWSQLLDLGGGLNDCTCVVYDDNDNIYMNNGGDVYKYNITGNSNTQISNAASFDTGILGGFPYGCITYFKGGLYAIIENAAATELSVWKYSGAGTTWSIVRDTGVAAGWSGHIISDGSQIVAVGEDNFSVGSNVVNYSSDGSSWNVGTLSLSPAPYAGAYNAANFSILGSNTATLGIWAYWDQHMGGAGVRDAYYVLQWNGTGFTTAKYYRYQAAPPLSSGDTWVPYYVFQDVRHWRIAIGVEAHTTDLNSWYTATAATPVRTHGFPSYSIGFTSPDFYTLTTADWSIVEDIWAGAGTLKSMVRLSSNYYPYAIVRLTGTGNNYVYGRGSAFSDPADPTNKDRLWIYRSSGGVDWSSRGLVAT